MAVIASTVAGLGTPSTDGAEGIIRVATGTEVKLFWNLAQGAWISRPETSMKQIETWGMTGGLGQDTWDYPAFGVGAADIDNAYTFQIHQVPDAHLLYAAGLRIQEHLTADLRKENYLQDDTVELALTWYSLDDGDAFLSPATPNHGVRLRVQPDVPYEAADPEQFYSRSSGWQNQPETIVPTKNFYPEIYVRGQVSFRRLHAQYRWVAGTVSGSSPEPQVDRPPLEPYLLTWLDANAIAQADGTAVESWPDYSARRWHLTQPNASKRPVVMTEGGIRFLRFDGVDDAMSTISAVTSGTAQPAAIFLVLRQRATGGTTQVWMGSADTTNPLVYRDGSTCHLWYGGGGDSSTSTARGASG